MRRLVYLLLLLPSLALAQGWTSVDSPAEDAFSWAKWWTEPIFSGFWMAWTRATLAFFLFIFSAIAVMTVLEVRRPGGAARIGILGLETTRGDRLFIGLLGSSYIFFAWLGLVGEPVYAPLALAIGWMAFCFWKV